MKKSVLAAALVGVMLLSGCSGVSQDEYNSLLEANSSLSSRNNVLTQKVSEQESANSSLSEANSQMSAEYEQLQKDAEPYLKLSEAERAAEMERLQKEEDERKAQEEAARQEEEAKGYETGITFKDISRSPEDYKGKKVKFSGRVLQVIEGYSTNQARMSTNGKYDDVILIEYKKDSLKVRLLEDDDITICGTFKYMKTYETVIGGSATVPLVNVDIIELKDENVSGLNSDTSKPTQTNATLGEQNALKQAKECIEYSAYSRQGLIDRLIREGYLESEAVYGADNSGADWNEQAVKQAAECLEYSAYSRQSLIDRLEREGFTHDQAVYGVTQNGY